MGQLTTNRQRRNDGRVRHASSVDGKKYTTRDMVRDYQRQKVRRVMAEQRAEREADAARRNGCFGVLLALLMGAGAIVTISQQWVG